MTTWVEKVASDTIKFLVFYVVNSLNFQVKFKGEEAEDAGGVTKEFFLLLIREILNPKYGMFKVYEETQTIWWVPLAAC